MRFSAPIRKPPGGRPSRGAEQKGRGCPRKKDAAIRPLRFEGSGAAEEAPSEQGATKAADLGAATAWPEPRKRSETKWNGAIVVGRPKGAAVLGKGGNLKKRTEQSRAQHFFRLPLVLPLPAPRQAQEVATQRTPLSPSVLIGEMCSRYDTFARVRLVVLAAE